MGRSILVSLARVRRPFFFSRNERAIIASARASTQQHLFSLLARSRSIYIRTMLCATGACTSCVPHTSASAYQRRSADHVQRERRREKSERDFPTVPERSELSRCFYFPAAGSSGLGVALVHSRSRYTSRYTMKQWFTSITFEPLAHLVGLPLGDINIRHHSP